MASPGQHGVKIPPDDELEEDEDCGRSILADPDDEQLELGELDDGELGELDDRELGDPDEDDEEPEDELGDELLGELEHKEEEDGEKRDEVTEIPEMPDDGCGDPGENDENPFRVVQHKSDVRKSGSPPLVSDKLDDPLLDDPGALPPPINLAL